MIPSVRQKLEFGGLSYGNLVALGIQPGEVTETQSKQVSHWSKILRFKKFKILDFKKQNHETQVDGTERCRAKSRLAGRQVVHQEGSWGGKCFMLIWKQEIGRKPIKGSIQMGQRQEAGGSVKSRPTGRRRGLNFQSASMLVQFPSFLPTPGEELRLSFGTWGLGPIWVLPSSCTDPIPHPLSKTQDLGAGCRSLPPFLKLQFIEHLLYARHYTKCLISINIFQN